MKYLGDIAEDATISFCWSTFDKNGASVTRSTDGTIKIRRHDDGTAITAGITDTEDTPDTGLHECIIDTSAHASYTAGDDYTVWLDGAVIDGETVNAVLAVFSIENRSQALATVCTETRLAELDAANLPSDVDAILTDTGTTLENRAIAIETDTADIQSQIGTAGAGLSDLGGMSTGMKAEVNAEVDTALNTAIPGSPTADSINERIAAIDNLTQASGAGDLAATKVKTDGLNFTGTDVKATLDGEETVTNSASRTASKADVSALALASICTEARLAELDAAKLPTDIDFIKNVQEGDVSIDTSATPWQAVVKIKGTDTELIRKDLADKDGNNIASVNALIGRYTEPS